jgi:hypothetical protein
VLDQAREYFTEAQPGFDGAWIGFLAVGFLVYAVLVWMKKRTRLLHVDGR